MAAGLADFSGDNVVKLDDQRLRPPISTSFERFMPAISTPNVSVFGISGTIRYGC
jgi:hypothetical protein